MSALGTLALHLYRAYVFLQLQLTIYYSSSDICVYIGMHTLNS